MNGNDKEAMRLIALSDPTSSYYKGISELLSQVSERENQVKKRTDRVMLPFPVSTETRRMLESRFGWTITSSDNGVRGRFPEALGALVYCMSLRNMLRDGADGEEVIALDEDLAMLSARGAGYVHVCRTNATARCQATYSHEDFQLQRLTTSKNANIAMASADMLAQIAEGGSARVCLDASKCRRTANVLLINHARTPVSLKQAVATARAHGCDTIRGEVFFQPDMLIKDEGQLEAFPGRYVVDRDRDLLSYVPDQDPGNGLSHPYADLMSFFVNHEYHDRKGRWLIEKTSGNNGMFTYVARRVDHEAFDSPEELTARYYNSSHAKVTRLEYPWYDMNLLARGRNPFVRRTANIYTDLFDRVMERMLAADAKHVNVDDVLVALRDRNNTSVVHGDTVRTPQRISCSDEVGAATAICALARWRRASASAELNVMLEAVKKRYVLKDATAWKLLQLAVSTKVGGWWIFGGDSGQFGDYEIEEHIDSWMRDVGLKVEQVDEFIAITQVVGASQYTVDSGVMRPWLPGGPGRFSSLLKRASDVIQSLSSGSSSVSVSIPARPASTVSAFPSSDERHSLSSDESYAAKLERSAEKAVVESVTHADEIEPISVELSAFQRSVVEKLTHDQDAMRVAKPVRVVMRYEGRERTDVVPVPTLRVPVVSAMQDDYDRIMPAVSQRDHEIVPYLASESDFVRNIDVNMAINDSKREIAPVRVVRRSKLRTAGTGPRPRDQAGLIAALFKRNGGVPATRGHVDLDTVASRVFDKVASVCFIDGWQAVIANELEFGLWQPTVVDLETYVPKVETHKCKKMLDEFFSLSDVDMTSWLLMTKGKVKPPVDLGAASKVALPQTIMYNESSGMNAMYSSMLSRFYDVLSSVMRPEVRLNTRDSSVDHEVWFNSLENKRNVSRSQYKYEGDIFCYDRSQESVGLSVEMELYRRMGLNKETLLKWEGTHGTKKATSMMLGVVIWITRQGLSGIFKTLFRNGYICLAAVVYSCNLTRDDLISLDVKGDDFLLETTNRISTSCGTENFALMFNLSSKFYGVEVAYFCSKYWLNIDGWWYWVADPLRKAESLSASVSIQQGQDTLAEKWISLREDLRHYDNGLVVDALADAVKQRMNLNFDPTGLIQGLAALAADRNEFMGFYGPEERIG